MKTAPGHICLHVVNYKLTQRRQHSTSFIYAYFPAVSKLVKVGGKRVADLALHEKPRGWSGLPRLKLQDKQTRLSHPKFRHPSISRFRAGPGQVSPSPGPSRAVSQCVRVPWVSEASPEHLFVCFQRYRKCFGGSSLRYICQKFGLLMGVSSHLQLRGQLCVLTSLGTVGPCGSHGRTETLCPSLSCPRACGPPLLRSDEGELLQQSFGDFFQRKLFHI